MYVHRFGNKWGVKKVVDGKQVYFGGFDSLEEAEAHRDYCMANDWDLKCRVIHYNPMKYIYKMGKTYAVVKRFNGRNYYFGRFKSLRKAKEHRDYCVKHGWGTGCVIRQKPPKEEGSIIIPVKTRVAKMFNKKVEDLP